MGPVAACQACVSRQAGRDGSTRVVDRQSYCVSAADPCLILAGRVFRPVPPLTLLQVTHKKRAFGHAARLPRGPVVTLFGGVCSSQVDSVMSFESLSNDREGPPFSNVVWRRAGCGTRLAWSSTYSVNRRQMRMVNCRLQATTRTVVGDGWCTFPTTRGHWGTAGAKTTRLIGPCPCGRTR